MLLCLLLGLLGVILLWTSTYGYNAVQEVTMFKIIKRLLVGITVTTVSVLTLIHYPDQVKTMFAALSILGFCYVVGLAVLE